MSAEVVSIEDLRDVWRLLTSEDLAESFLLLSREEAEDFLDELPTEGRVRLLRALPLADRRLWARQLDPDDAADVVQELEEDEREDLLALLDPPTRVEVRALLAYAEDDAGGLMSPRFARVRPDMTVEEAIRYVRRQARGELETVYYIYVVDPEGKLLGVVSFRELLTAPDTARVRDIMTSDLVTVPEDLDQEDVARLVAQHDLLALPVVDAAGRIRGIVTFDDVADVLEEEVTEDIHKLGGSQALDQPYIHTGILEMVKKRAGWLTVLLLGEMLTTSAMGRFEAQLQAAVVLAVFVPLIISSGGNSGSQSSTLIIRAMALGEIRPRDWWRIARREVLSGLLLGLILGLVGFLRVVGWQAAFATYGEHGTELAFTVGFSLVGVVLCGTLAGALLPFLLRALRFDPASASAPFVSTLVDVTGIVIYFTVARLILAGSLM